MTPEEKQEVVEETERRIAKWFGELPGIVHRDDVVAQMRSGKWRERPLVTLTLPEDLAVWLDARLSGDRISPLFDDFHKLLKEAMAVEPEEPAPAYRLQAGDRVISPEGHEGTVVETRDDEDRPVRVALDCRGRHGPTVWFKTEGLERVLHGPSSGRGDR